MFAEYHILALSENIIMDALYHADGHLATYGGQKVAFATIFLFHPIFSLPGSGR
jgi:hypothetical protein